MVIMLKRVRELLCEDRTLTIGEKAQYLDEIKTCHLFCPISKFFSLVSCPGFNKLKYNYYRRLLFHRKPVKIQFTLKAQAETSHAAAVATCWLV